MRLQRLDLTRYGHFTDRSVELPSGQADFHIVFGPNEAGKSTALAAIEDLLFGIHGQSPYNFLHDYTEMRIGAVIENGAATLPVVRRKGNKDTLLGTDGLPISGGEGALAPFLKGVDRTFFVRMFSLDHMRLEQGGQDILQAKDDVGEMLFSAGAGIAGLRDQLNALLEEADNLWSRTRAKRRLYYQAYDAMKDAEATLRDQLLSAAKWRDLKNNYEKAQDAYRKADEAFKKGTAERSRLNRIRRVYSDVRRKQELDGGIEALSGVVLLPDDAGNIFEAAERKVSAANALIETFSGQLKQAQTERDDLAFDETLVLRADDVARLHEQRIEVAGERADLPNREAELQREEDALREHADELDWHDEDVAALIKRIPGRTAVGVARTLLNERGGLTSDVTNRTDALQEAKEALADFEETLGGLDEPADVSELAAVIRAIREKGDIAGWVRDADKEVTQAQRRVNRLLGSLKPGVDGEKDLLEMEVPPRASVQTHGGLVQTWQVNTEDNRRQIKAVERSLAKSEKDRTQVVSAEHAVAPETLQEARARRNNLWRLVKRKHIDAAPISKKDSDAFADDLDDLAGAFEPAMQQADQLADRRFETAEATARIAEISRTIERQQDELGQLKEDEKTLSKEGERLTTAWTALWESAPFEPLEPDAMLAWLDTREKVLEAIEARDNAAGELENERTQETEARTRLETALAALDFDTPVLQDKPLGEVLELAADEQRRIEGEAARKGQLQSDVKDAGKNVARRQQQLVKAEEALSKWQGKWGTAIAELGLAADALPETVAAQVDVIDLMRESDGRIEDLRRNRIDKINRDIADFEQSVAALVEQIADDLKGQPADDAMLAIEARSEEARRLKGLRDSKNRDIEDLEKKIATATQGRDEAAASVNHLKEAASVETDDALKEAIGNSDRLRALEAERAAVLQKLEKEGDGLSIEDLEKECAGVDIDQIAAQEAALETELADLRQQHLNAAETRTTARQAFEAVGGNDAAAQAAAARQEALADVRAISERYVRVRTSAILLQWAIDRYRREKQAPLLKRAGELFATITGNSFDHFSVVYDEHDQPRLTGVRPDGNVVAVSGMSTGTADQLYMALRAAAIEDYLERADAMPFVADDLFINFDDDRAASGFKVLGQLAEKTQVLFFTHHQHLVDIARNTLGNAVQIVSLLDAQAASAA